jgi:hypothetical protein
MSGIPEIYGLFHKRIEGDDTLLALAALRFRQHGLAAELYAETPQELSSLVRFNPKRGEGSSAAVHLPRDIDILSPSDRKRVIDFARAAGGELFGMVVHDQPEAETRFGDYVGALRDLDRRLDRMGDIEGLGAPSSPPMVFIEYAALLAPDVFLSIFEATADLEHVSACIDIGHVGLRQARVTYAKKHPSTDVCGIAPTDPTLSEIIEDIQAATASGLEATLSLTSRLCQLQKPLHFHLHDAHPLSTLSPFGVSDHLSFFELIPIPFAHRGKQSVDLMYGPSGLSKVVGTAMRYCRSKDLTLSLEIHPTTGALPLRDAAHLFDHWQDKTNAERMNLWLATLGQNHRLLEDACRRVAELLGLPP